MSFIGKNIRKIRQVKRLTQTEFAELFDIKRASIGAYEEGRAEPKIDAISRIANYFSISLDKLITKELTVNDLYGFDIFKEGLTSPEKNTLKPSVTSNFVDIPYIGPAHRKEFLQNTGNHQWISSLPQIRIPVPEKGDLLALMLKTEDLNANILSKYKTGDFVVGKKLEENRVFEANNAYLVVNEERIKVLEADAAHNDRLKKEQNSICWKIIGCFSSGNPENPWIEKILNLDERVKSLEVFLKK